MSRDAELQAALERARARVAVMRADTLAFLDMHASHRRWVRYAQGRLSDPFHTHVLPGISGLVADQDALMLALLSSIRRVVEQLTELDAGFREPLTARELVVSLADWLDLATHPDFPERSLPWLVSLLAHVGHEVVAVRIVDGAEGREAVLAADGRP